MNLYLSYANIACAMTFMLEATLMQARLIDWILLMPFWTAYILPVVAWISVFTYTKRETNKRTR